MKTNKKRLPPLTDEEEARIQAGIAVDPDAPELTDERLAAMRPATEVFPESFFESIDEMRRSRGRPPSANPKRPVTIRLDADVIDRFKATGKGWQSRMNEVLRKAKP
jgi:uncharacterized protein (DUF4415 family)